MNFFVYLYGFILVQRLVEVLVAKYNEKWMKERGAVEVAGGHYKYIVIVHTLFFISILLEAYPKEILLSDWKGFLLGIFFVTQGFRIWCLSTLGRYWNTKIIILPGSELVKKGPYKIMKHPNYFIVAVEFVVIPLLFSAYVTAIVFPLLHGLLMLIRIPHENRALEKISE
ncbi:isoprenylcysteine carboxyl methyltransferase [Pontibacillus halophilus JSM 076056 = DSM 19796]|uniref:Isoprenylcysteine carboxyl methyltransferase n=1 Tax=Pontibacillus halophilus JSM 076056 = DSM 19796 TaxID=1385510 RepID=A0A0A5GIU8_9BACI|nr:isoprenylcysteine carboxylmethyltransferase family protein [Pontibacillus halophilus]KGX91934.1 isoprenylcysteine carboxyl methyltransferase [Pontibacillus halophilus JSM 076056 = DSM 19796]